MTHAEIAAEQVIHWRRCGLTPGECLAAMAHHAPASSDWYLVANVIAVESRRMAVRRLAVETAA